MHTPPQHTPALAPLHGPNPRPLITDLREQCPVHRAVGPEGQDVYYLTRHADALAALADPRLSVDKAHAAPGAWNGYALPAALNTNLLNLDGERHARIRRHAAPTFAGPRLRTVTDALEPLAHTLLSHAAAIGTPGTADLVSGYAMPLAVHAICALFGADPADAHRFTGWTACLLDPGRRAEYPAVLGELLGYLRTALDTAKREPAPGLLADIAHAEATGELSGDEATSLAFLTFFAGFDNSCNLTAQVLIRVLTDPAVRASITDMAAAPGIIAETARRDGPVMLAIRRFATEDLTVAGASIPKGSPVLIGIASAERDPRAWLAPDGFDPKRTGGRSLAFGHGPHACPGARLALAEAQTAAAVLITRYPAARLATAAEDLPYRPSTRTRGVAELPVVLNG